MNTKGPDPELDALERCLHALLPLDADARVRLIGYLGQRLPSLPVMPPEARETWRRVDLWYPNVKGNPLGLEIELQHTRAARSIRVGYDFGRDGFTITAQADPGDGEFDAEAETKTPWLEVAFVPAWHDPEASP